MRVLNLLFLWALGNVMKLDEIYILFFCRKVLYFYGKDWKALILQRFQT